MLLLKGLLCFLKYHYYWVVKLSIMLKNLIRICDVDIGMALFV